MPSKISLISKKHESEPFVRSIASAIQVRGQTSPVKDRVWEALPCLWGAGADIELSARHKPNGDPLGHSSSNKVAPPPHHCPGHCKKKTTGKEHLSHWHKEATIHKVYPGRIRGKAEMEPLVPAFVPITVLLKWESIPICSCSEEENICIL